VLFPHLPEGTKENYEKPQTR